MINKTHFLQVEAPEANIPLKCVFDINKHVIKIIFLSSLVDKLIQADIWINLNTFSVT